MSHYLTKMEALVAKAKRETEKPAKKAKRDSIPSPQKNKPKK